MHSKEMPTIDPKSFVSPYTRKLCLTCYIFNTLFGKFGKFTPKIYDSIGGLKFKECFCMG